MKAQRSIFVFVLLGAGLLVSCASRERTVKVPVSVTLGAKGSMAARMFEEVNAYRRSQGIMGLERHAGLDHLAQQHCEYLRQHRGTFLLQGKNVSHIGFDGRVLVARERFQMINVSENVAASNRAGANPAPIILALWKGSKDHRKNMLDKWTHTGVGVVVDADGMVFVDELFATVSHSQMATRERFNRF